MDGGTSSRPPRDYRYYSLTDQESSAELYDSEIDALRVAVDHPIRDTCLVYGLSRTRWDVLTETEPLSKVGTPMIF